MSQNVSIPNHTPTSPFADIITDHPQMFAVFDYIETIAATTQPVLITGETGVGKELIAGAIHRCSRRNGSLITVNVAGLDDHLFSDTLFGHARGAYTSADQNRPGLIEKARSGTLFLDEIGDLSHSSQVKLLRLLQEGEYRALGSDLLRRSNARIIAATNADLWEKQRSGSFRQDLNFRLRTHHIDIPPLRKRIEDLPILIDFFIGKAATTLSKKKPAYPKELIDLLRTYAFPGNIRELESMIFDAVSRHSGKILSLDRFHQLLSENRSFHFQDRPQEAPGPTSLVTFTDELPTIKTATRLLVAEALRRANGNQTMAAKMLGITRQALGKRVKNMQGKDRDTE